MTACNPDRFDLHTAQRFMMLGQWLDDHEYILKTIRQAIANECAGYVDDEDDYSCYMTNILQVDMALQELLNSMDVCKKRIPNLREFESEYDNTLTLHRPLACAEHARTALAHVESDGAYKPTEV